MQNEISDPLVTVLMPVFNAEKYLRLAIESVLNQSYSYFEFLIIDDGSTDQSAQIIRSYSDPRIRFLQNECNLGLVTTLNRGIESSQGQYLARMDADDISYPQRLEKQVALLNINRADICGSYCDLIDEHGILIKHLSMPLDNDTLTICLGNSVPFAHGSVMLRKDFLLQHNLHYELGNYAEDYDLWIKMYACGARFVNCNESLYYYRHFSKSLSSLNREKCANAAKILRRQFIQENDQACIKALGSLTTRLEQLSYSERVNSIFVAYQLGRLTGNWQWCWPAIGRASPKMILHGIYRIWKA